MLSFTANDTTFDEACRTALELIEEISAIPLEYMRAMGLAMVRVSSSLGCALLTASSCRNCPGWVISLAASSKKNWQSLTIST
jgi:hypothetical protein